MPTATTWIPRGSPAGPAATPSLGTAGATGAAGIGLAAALGPEPKECCGFTAETSLNSKWILAVHANHQFTFNRSLTGNTANRHLLLATQGFADLPGAPAPDFIIPDGFLPLEGDTLEYWLYDAATWIFGALPLDGTSSLGADGSPAINSPTNYAGESGSIDLTVPVERLTWGGLKARQPR